MLATVLLNAVVQLLLVIVGFVIVVWLSVVAIGEAYKNFKRND